MDIIDLIYHHKIRKVKSSIDAIELSLAELS